MLRPRTARRDDYAAFLRFWQHLGMEQAPISIDWWDQHYRPHTQFLEAENGDVVAYALTIPLGTRGDVRQIAVDPAWRGRGVGKQVMAAVATKLRAAGCRDWHLEVQAKNEPAIALYRSVGMQVLHEIDVLRMAKETAERLAATRSGRLHVEEVDPAQDGALEQHFDLGGGQIMRWRTARLEVKPRAPLWHIAGVALTHYWASFMPERGLMFPFRAPDADHAAHLLAAALDYGMPPSIEICAVERPVCEALCAAGAERYDQQLEMGGAL